MKAGEIAKLVGGELIGDPNVELHSVAGFSSAKEGDLAFSEKSSPDQRTHASCLIAARDYDGDKPAALIIVGSPKLQFARASALIIEPKSRPPEMHSTAVIASDANVSESAFIGAFCCVGEGSTIGAGTHLRAGAKVGDNVSIGKECVLHPNVFIEDGCTIGDRVILHSGVVIGADGFGYVKDGDGSYVKFPQIGTVTIEDDVEIGANTCVDRGALGETRIGEGTKVDNLVQVGHNVSIGKRCVIAAQTGISGSVTIEDDCVIGGQVGFGDHVRVQSGAVIGSQAGVLPGKIVRPGVWWGTPIQPLDDYKKQNALVKGLGRLREKISRIEKLVSAGEDHER
jgi:UDP-3-O-[3-hydroxymyristoyl] glucosamine N-acyltransferase